MRKKPPFHRPVRLELEYQREISRVMDEWLNEPALRTLDSILETLSRFGKIGELVDPQVERIAAGMVTAVAAGNARSWREAAKEATQGRRIYQLLREELSGPLGKRYNGLVREHARLISSIPQELAQETARYIQRRQLEGDRASVIAGELRRKLPKMAQWRVDRLARTQVASAATAITRSRSEALNLNWYEWDTSGDARVRASHRLMDLVLVNWNDPPAPEQLLGVRSTLGHYHAGNCPNCRCDPNVVVDLDLLSWPHKVYTGGRIVRMAKAAFLKLAA